MKNGIMMKLARRMKINTRIIIGFVVLIVLLLVNGSFSIINMNLISGQNELMVETSEARYHTGLARTYVSDYVKAPSVELIEKVNNELVLAKEYATNLQSQVNRSEDRALMDSLVRELNDFQNSFNIIVNLQDQKLAAVETKAEAAFNAGEQFNQILRIQQNIVKNNDDADKVHDAFEVYRTALKGYHAFLEADLNFATYVSNGDEQAYNNSIELINKSIEELNKSVEIATDPSYSIYSGYALEYIDAYLVAVEGYKLDDQYYVGQIETLTGVAEEVSSIAETAEVSIIESIDLVWDSGFMQVIVIVILSVVIGIGSAYYISQSIRIPLNDYIKRLKRFGAGDLTVSFDSNGKDELADMGHALSDMEQSLSGIIEEVTQIANGFKSISSEVIERSKNNNANIEHGMAETLKMSAENEESIGHVAVAIEEISNGTNSSVEATAESAQSATETKNISKDVANKMNQVDEEILLVEKQSQSIAKKMNDVQDSIDEIGGFVKRITDIADQTNLLALNAAIEAARAGEQGKGFSVVADEVRKLAEESSVASNEINRIIAVLNNHAKDAISEVNLSSESIEKVVQVTNETKDGMDKSLDEIDKLSLSMDSIASVTEQQAASSEEILATTEDLRNITKNVASNINDVNEVAKESAAIIEEDLNNIIKRASELVELLGYFEL